MDDANGNPSNELSMDTEEYCVAYNSNPGGHTDPEKDDLIRLYTCRSNTPLTTFRTRHNWIRNDIIPLDANAKAVWQIGNDKSLAIKCPPQHLQSSRGIARAPTLSTDLDASLSRIDSLRARATILREDQSTAPIPLRRYLTQLLEVLQNQLSEGDVALRIAEREGMHRLRPGTWRRIHRAMREAQAEVNSVQAQVDEVHTEEEEAVMLEEEIGFLTQETGDTPHPPSPSSPSARSPFSPTSKNKKNLKASRKKKSKKKKSKGKKSKRKKKSKGKRK